MLKYSVSASNCYLFLQFLTKNEIKNEVSLQLKSELCLFNDKNMRIIKISGERQLATI